MTQISPQTVLAFDVYGTLIDTHALVPVLQGLVGDHAAQVSDVWRQKQLEYSFRRGLMRDFVPFSTVTAQALDFALATVGADVGADAKSDLLARYRRLDAFDDAGPALAALARAGTRRYAFSNGDPQDIQTLLETAGLWGALDGAVSVLPAATFKPAPETYAHFCAQTDTPPEHCWLVSSNPFDVIGARHAGWQAVWIRRRPDLPFDPWGIAPSLTLSRLTELMDHMTP